MAVDCLSNSIRVIAMGDLQFREPAVQLDSTPQQTEDLTGSGDGMIALNVANVVTEPHAVASGCQHSTWPRHATEPLAVATGGRNVTAH